MRMCTSIRPEVTTSNKYWISKHRYYELKHFCLQYYEWKDLYSKLEGTPATTSFDVMPHKCEVAHPTEKVAIAKAEYAYNMKMIEDVAKLTDPELSTYIFMAVTRGLPYNNLLTVHGIPCCKDTFYDRYRKFFWLLSSYRR